MAQSNKDIQGYRGGRGGYNNYNNYNRGNSYGYGSNNNNYTYRRNRNEPPRGGRSYYDSDRDREFQKWDYEQSAGSRAHRSDTRWEESRRDQREEEINRPDNTYNHQREYQSNQRDRYEEARGPAREQYNTEYNQRRRDRSPSPRMRRDQTEY